MYVDKINKAEWSKLTSLVQEIIQKNDNISDSELIIEVQKTFTTFEADIILPAIRSSRTFMLARNTYRSKMSPLEYGDDNKIRETEDEIKKTLKRLYLNDGMINAAIYQGRAELRERAFNLINEVVLENVSCGDLEIGPQEKAKRIAIDKFNNGLNQKIFGMLVSIIASQLEIFKSYKEERRAEKSKREHTVLS